MRAGVLSPGGEREEICGRCFVDRRVVFDYGLEDFKHFVDCIRGFIWPIRWLRARTDPYLRWLCVHLFRGLHDDILLL